MRVVLTGAHGFLGWHTRVRHWALTGHDVVPVGREQWPDLPDLVRGADAVVHVAGVNRGGAGEVEEGNLRLARDLASAVLASGGAPAVVFANSVQRSADSPYGRGKAGAAALIGEACAATGGSFTDVVLPNLFGEHGRADYNSFVATFAHCVARGEEPAVADRDVELLHAQDAAQALLDALGGEGHREVRPAGTTTAVGVVLEGLRRLFADYRHGDIPALTSPFDVRLFNTLRAAMFPAHYPMPLTRHADRRGALVETVRAHGGGGQAFVSTTRPGITRGQHVHLRKVERFVVVGGQACIRLRRLFTDRVVSFDVTGERPAIIDMPTFWAHNLTNTGRTDLITQFWTNELFDPQDTDTYPEDV